MTHFTPITMTRRMALQWIGVGALVAAAPAFAASSLPKVVVNKDPNCGCCEAWAEHLKAAGFPVDVIARQDMAAVKTSLGVPDDLTSCHSGVVDGYVVEGHVPAQAIKRLLAERPAATGLSAPGMPMGSPGMEGGTPETFDVVLFGPAGRSVFGRYRGDSAV